MIDLFVSGFPVANVLLIIVLLVLSWRQKPFSFILFFMIYCAFHFAYAVPSVLAGDGTSLNAFHYISNVKVLVAEALFFCVWTLLVVKEYKKEIFNDSYARKIFIGLLSVYVTIFILSYIFFPQTSSQTLAIKDNISLLLLLFFTYLFSILLQNGKEWGGKDLNWLMFSALLVLGVGLYEVFAGFSWAMALLPDGRLLSRASSTMFNPNVLGLWAGLLIVFSVYLYDQKKEALAYISTFFLFGIIGIYITGSRTSFLFCLALLLVVSGLKLFAGIRLVNAFKAPFVFMGVFFTLCLLGSLQGGMLQPLSDRFLSVPKSIVQIYLGDEVNSQVLTAVYGRLGIDESEEAKRLAELIEAERVAKAIAAAEQENILAAQASLLSDGPSVFSGFFRIISVEVKVGYYKVRGWWRFYFNDRVSGVKPVYDNGYLALRMNNFMTYIVWLFMLLYFVVIGVKRFWIDRSLEAVYALSSLAGFILIGFLLRAYQVFPVWGLSSLMLAIFIVWVTGRETKCVQPSVS